MLVALVLVWAVLAVAVVAVCAAGGAADDESERWYARRKEAQKPKGGPERDAA
jgi:hypothetical protein